VTCAPSRSSSRLIFIREGKGDNGAQEHIFPLAHPAVCFVHIPKPQRMLLIKHGSHVAPSVAHMSVQIVLGSHGLHDSIDIAGSDGSTLTQAHRGRSVTISPQAKCAIGGPTVNSPFGYTLGQAFKKTVVEVVNGRTIAPLTSM
jgi:hypothetical protein